MARLARSSQIGLFPALLILTLIGVWEVAVRATGVPIYILPPPSQIAFRLLSHAPNLLIQGGLTLIEALLGFALGCGVSLIAAAAMVHSPVLERSLLPLAILLKVTPVVAVAPLLVIWLGFGVAPRAVVAALLTFYPMLIGALSGFRSVSREASDLFASLAASRWEVFRFLRWPAALPHLFTAARVAVPLSLIGAVVAEWAGAEGGLGRAVLLAYTNLDLPELFAAVVVLGVIGTVLTALLGLIERQAVFWTRLET